jgi:SprT-like family protein
MSEQLPLLIDGPAVAGDAETGRVAPFLRVFRRLRLERPAPEFQVEYFPFAGLKSTIRLRNGRAHVRLSDLLSGAPPLVLEALAEILLCQVFRRRASREARECYLAFVTAPAMRSRIDEVRCARGTKRLLSARGRYFDLNEIFTKLNRKFFQGKLAQPRLGWSPKRSRTVLGHHDSAHQTITISRRLDARSASRYLVEYVVYHEMLHMHFPTERKGQRRVVHSRQFREAEKRFPKYEQTRKRLKHFCA